MSAEMIDASGLTRRRLLNGCVAAAALAVAPRRLVAAPLPRDADIVVIGAGAAGIAAARRIAAAGRKVVIVEASARIGGRCATDGTALGVPFDRGARWLYGGDASAIGKLVRGAGIDTYAAPPGQRIRIGRRFARAGETEEFLATLVRANRALDEASRRGDIACAPVMPKDLGVWTGTADFVLGPSAFGRDLADLSTVDRGRAQDRGGALATRQGLGTLLTKLAGDIPVVLATPATRIVWGTRDVSVETSAGKIAAKGAIVTVSSHVLASGALKFAPDLPKRTLDAAAKLPLGTIERIALALDGNALGLGRDEVVIEQSTSARTASLYANIAGSNIVTVDVAGSFGRDLSAQGDAALVAFARDWLTALFGSDAAARVKATAVTRWNAMPFIGGAVSAAAPGAAGARRILAEPVGAVQFAGEATHETAFGTLDGAWDSGERAADAALRRIGAIKGGGEEPANPRPVRKRVPQAAPKAAPSSGGFPSFGGG